jgi:hypothetical protein
MKYPRILAIIDDAQSEHVIEANLDRMSAEMNQASFSIVPFKPGQTYILSSSRDITMLIDEQKAAVSIYI